MTYFPSLKLGDKCSGEKANKKEFPKDSIKIKKANNELMAYSIPPFSLEASYSIHGMC
ncbi:hypothetical protein HMPREF9499_01497 [Enterococcus faecalis TX0012]|nr:hypothetical protein HMPREF9499_01497 [Enterococcus faecalis TX0012]